MNQTITCKQNGCDIIVDRPGYYCSNHRTFKPKNVINTQNDDLAFKVSQLEGKVALMMQTIEFLSNKIQKLEVQPKEEWNCKTEGCSNKTTQGHLCVVCYKLVKKTTKTNKTKTPKVSEGKETKEKKACITEGCSGKTSKGELCFTCFKLLKKTNKVSKEESSTVTDSN